MGMMLVRRNAFLLGSLVIAGGWIVMLRVLPWSGMKTFSPSMTVMVLCGGIGGGLIPGFGCLLDMYVAKWRSIDWSAITEREVIR